MKRFFYAACLLAILLPLCGQTQAQTTQTVGLFTHLPGSEDDGYVLFYPQTSDTTYLIDKCGRLVHKWGADCNPGLDAHLLPDGSLLRSGYYANPVFDLSMGSAGGLIERYDWNGNLLWRYLLSDMLQTQNHDVWPMPNGNVLAAVWEVISDSEALAGGVNPALIGTSLWTAKVMELQPVGTDSAIVVWQWRVWDHLVQDYDSTKPNYGVVADHPELLNLNYIDPGTAFSPDWLHLNQVTYNPALDQVMLSAHNIDEIWIIDHSTTTAQAATHTGGTHNKGGDFLYRWGNPNAYDRGTTADIQLFEQHDPEWITNGKYANQIMVFNNGLGRPSGDASSVDVIIPPVDTAGNYAIAPGAAYGPASAAWSYMASPATSFFSIYMGSAQTLPNDNVLICDAMSGHFFEIDTNKNVVWDYISPVSSGVALAQGTTMPLYTNSSYRCKFYISSYSGFTGHTLTPGAPIELDPLSYTCVTTTGVKTIPESNTINIFPNPADDYLTISSAENINHITISNLQGQTMYNMPMGQSDNVQINVASLPPGIYFIRINNETVRKFVKE